MVVGRGRVPAWVDEACADWVKRVSRTFPTRLVAELPKLPARARVVLLDERGETRDSQGFAALLEEGIRAAASPLVFAIGGPYGHDEPMRRRADRVVRLSDLVLNHAVARVVLVEQLYRACAIRSGSPYHHGD